jgi:uncharacterized phage-like protein YoqJ
MIVAGTGHRPKFCPCKYDDNHPWLISLKQDLKARLEKDRPKVVISGMAIGYDTWLAQVALEEGFTLHAYLPFRGQETKWPEKAQKEYRRLLTNAEERVYCSESYSNQAFLLRDRMMMDDATDCWALLNPEADSGGTFYTVRYADEIGIPVLNFWRD